MGNSCTKKFDLSGDIKKNKRSNPKVPIVNQSKISIDI